MLEIRLADRAGAALPHLLAVPVAPGPDGGPAVLVPTTLGLDDDLRAELADHLADSEHSGKRGVVISLPRPQRLPRRVLLAGVGPASDEGGWRAAGAAIARAAGSDSALTIAMPAPGDGPDATDSSATDAAGEAAADRVRGVAEGLWLASYTFQVTRERVPPTGAAVDTTPDDTLHQVTLVVHDADAMSAALTDAHTTASATRFARDLTNMPSEDKTPAWFADQIRTVAAGHERLTAAVREPDELAASGFGGIIAVGSGSARGPRLLELSFRPEQASTHVVLVGKGITFDTGGISIKPRDAMSLMRKDMGGAAAIMAATLAAAEMDLPVRITALAPLAENAVSGSAMRPGDVVHHYGGKTSEVLNTDAEGRLVLADVLAYADARLDPDYLIDLATLTGANAVALGKRTAALFTDNDALAGSLIAAATEAGEQIWRLPLHDDYLREIRSDVADLANSSSSGAGAITAALFLREFTGRARKVWAHLDMSAPSWAAAADAELTKGATGWGVRTLLRWLAGL